MQGTQKERHYTAGQKIRSLCSSQDKNNILQTSAASKISFLTGENKISPSHRVILFWLSRHDSIVRHVHWMFVQTVKKYAPWVPDVVWYEFYEWCYLALINRAGGLYGRVLNEVVSTDRTQWGLRTRDKGKDCPIQTDLAGLIRCLLHGKNKNNLIRFMCLVCTNWHSACERRWAELNSSRVQSSFLLYFLISFLALADIYILLDKNSQWFCILVSNLSLQNIGGLDAGLNGKI